MLTSTIKKTKISKNQSHWIKLHLKTKTSLSAFYTQIDQIILNKVILKKFAQTS